MPIYEYACRKCGAAFEHLARTLSDTAKACPECGAPTPEKQFSTFSTSDSASEVPACARDACPTCPQLAACPAGGCAV